MIHQLFTEDERASFAVARRELDRETPQFAWFMSSYARGRASIAKALRVDRDDTLAAYATHPFRIMEADDQNWIAGAIGCPPALSTDLRDWGHLDIGEVVLWNPRTSEVRILGQHRTAATLVGLETGASERDEVTVFADGFEFFRAWADRRAEFCAAWMAARASTTVAIPREPSCGNLPGLLAVGDLAKMPWRSVSAAVLKAGAGVDPAKLKTAIFRAANLPRITSDTRSAA